MGSESKLAARPDYDPDTGLTDARRAFLEERYLAAPYVVPPDVDMALHEGVSLLRLLVPRVSCIVNVGGTANGSLALRRQERGKTATELDLFLVGSAVANEELEIATDVIKRTAKTYGFATHGELNGQRPSNYLDLDKIGDLIEHRDFHLLALPFGSCYGRTTDARRQVVGAVVDRPDNQLVWEEVANAHAESLSMHHGSWSTVFGNTILRDYYPQKIEAFRLPDSLSQAASELR